MTKPITVPVKVINICTTLTNAGFQAVCVGGAVRDAIMGRKPHDWDVATSALPGAIQKLFPRNVPTGLQHGTVTVMDGTQAFEVTTFRQETGYSDSRHPDQVTFGATLIEDLGRRDLTVNAIAYDPITKEFHDPFGGMNDIEAKTLRAVGNPVDRFTEDGLRVMRAVRFAAVLEFNLDHDTRMAIPACLPSLEKVSIERVRDELDKLIHAPNPGPALRMAFHSGIIKTVLPELEATMGNGDTIDHLLARMEAPTLNGRMAAVLSYVPNIDAVLRRLKFSNQDRERLVRLAKVGNATVIGTPNVRRLLSQAGKNIGSTVCELWEAHALNAMKEVRLDMALSGKQVLNSHDPLSVSDLAVTGNDLITKLEMKPGKSVGEMLKALLEHTFDNPADNQFDTLLAIAKSLQT